MRKYFIVKRKFREINLEFREIQLFYFREIQKNYVKISCFAKFLKCCFAATQPVTSFEHYRFIRQFLLQFVLAFILGTIYRPAAATRVLLKI